MKVVLKNARLAFPSIWEPKSVDAKSEPRCSASFIIDPKAQAAEVKKVVEAMKQVASEKWGAKAADVLNSLKAKGDLCLHDGATKTEYDGFAGNMYVSAANKARPVVLGKDKSPLTQADGKPYSGCYVNVSLDIWAQDNQFGKRINAKLLAIQFERDGEAFSGGASYDEADFEDESEPAGDDNFFS